MDLLISIKQSNYLPLHSQKEGLENIPVYIELCHPLSRVVNGKSCDTSDIHWG